MVEPASQTSDNVPRRDPLAVFVHIPKTAGSTFNSLLLRHHAARVSPRLWPLAGRLLPGPVIDNSVTGRWLSQAFAGGCSHLELYRSRPRTLRRILGQADWISAHLTRRDLAARLEEIGRPAEYFTVIRDPVRQVASHYQWWIEIYRRGPWRYLRYNGYFRDLSRRIRATDNRDPDAIIAVLRDHWFLFLNFQARYVADLDETPDLTLTDAAALAALGRFAAVGLDDGLGPVFARMTGSPPPPIGRINPTRSGFDRKVFDAPAMRDFLARHNAADEQLYRVARAALAAQDQPADL